MEISTLHYCKKTINTALILLAGIILLYNSSIAQNQINKIELPLLNQAIIYYSKLPTDYKSDLSEDKKIITITIANTSISNSSINRQSTGVIQNVTLTENGSSTVVKIICNDKRGYTVSALPYSKALSIEVFRWDKLNGAEDNYRSGLLALNDNLINSAKTYFVSAFNAEHANAAAQLGLISLQEGKLKSSAKYFLQAHKGGCNIADAYAGISQLFKFYKRQDKADYFSKVFFRKSGLSTFSEISFSADSLAKDSAGTYEILMDPGFGDTVRIFTARDSISSSMNKPYFKSDTISTKKEVKENVVWEIIKSLFPPWISTAMIIGAVFLLLFGIVLYFRYIKWRKDQQEKLKDRFMAKNFNKDLKTAQTNISGRADAVNAYRKAGAKPEVKEESQTERINKAVLEAKKDAIEKQRSLIPIEEKTINFEDKLERIARELMAANKAGKDAEESGEAPVTPSVKLAMHLQDEQKKIKKEQFDKIQEFDIPTNVDELSEIAKKMGVEKGSLEAKRDISQLENSEEKLSKLADKFSVNNNKE